MYLGNLCGEASMNVQIKDPTAQCPLPSTLYSSSSLAVKIFAFGAVGPVIESPFKCEFFGASECDLLLLV